METMTEHAAPSAPLFEEWRSVPGFDGKYEVSSLGSVRNAWTGKRFKLSVHSHRGYPVTTLTHPDGRRTQQHAHLLVLRSFVGEAPDGYVGAHLNGNPGDPRLCNLKWVTQKVNASHRKRHGTAGNTTKLTDEQVASIREMAQDRRASYVEIASACGTTSATAYNVIHSRYCYSDLPPVDNRVRRARYDAEDANRAIDLAGMGHGVDAIAAEIGCSRTTVGKWLRAESSPGATKSGPHDRPQLVWTEARAMRRLRGVGISCAVIADAFGVTTKTVSDRTRGVELPELQSRGGARPPKPVKTKPCRRAACGEQITTETISTSEFNKRKFCCWECRQQHPRDLRPGVRKCANPRCDVPIEEFRVDARAWRNKLYCGMACKREHNGQA